MMGAYFALDNPDEVMGIFPADHLIVGHKKFEKVINTADYVAKKRRKSCYCRNKARTCINSLWLHTV